MKIGLCNENVVWMRKLQWHQTQSLTHIRHVRVALVESLIRISVDGSVLWLLKSVSLNGSHELIADVQTWCACNIQL